MGNSGCMGLEWAPVAKRLSPGAPVGVTVSLHTAVGVTGLLCVCRSGVGVTGARHLGVVG